MLCELMAPSSRLTDVLLDWSLGKRNSKHPYLRQELGFFKDNWWLYYVFSVVNVILRFSWVLYLAPHPSPSVQGYIIALVEASRRIMWNTFRVEAEHIGELSCLSLRSVLFCF